MLCGTHYIPHCCSQRRAQIWHLRCFPWLCSSPEGCPHFEGNRQWGNGTFAGLSAWCLPSPVSTWIMNIFRTQTYVPVVFSLLFGNTFWIKLIVIPTGTIFPSLMYEAMSCPNSEPSLARSSLSKSPADKCVKLYFYSTSNKIPLIWAESHVGRTLSRKEKKKHVHFHQFKATQTAFTQSMNYSCSQAKNSTSRAFMKGASIYPQFRPNLPQSLKHGRQHPGRSVCRGSKKMSLSQTHRSINPNQPRVQLQFTNTSQNITKIHFKATSTRIVIFFNLFCSPSLKTQNKWQWDGGMFCSLSSGE